jgi:ComF family protein
MCRRCSEEPREIDGIRSPFIFKGIIRQAIHELKYHNLRALAPTLAELLHEYLEKNPITGDVLVPVPLHRKRLKERGYNQAALIAAELGKLRGLPVVADCLVRYSYAPPQARSGAVDERHRNVAGAFACRDGRLSGQRVIIIDDVATSGATLNAGAGALKAAGAAAVWGLTLALEP